MRRGLRDAANEQKIRELVNGWPAGKYSEKDFKDPGDRGLDAKALHAVLDSYEKGGLPSNSTPEAISGTREPPLPALDGCDREIIEARLGYSQALAEAVKFLSIAKRWQNRYLLTRPPVDERVAEPAKTKCSVMYCDNDAERDRTICTRCRKARQRHGPQWTPKQENNGEAA